TNAAAPGNPNPCINATHNGENTAPPILAPLYALANADGRCAAYQRATTALTATAPVIAHPAPLTNAATNNCHGCATVAQPNTPSAVHTAPNTMLGARPSRTCSRGRLATTNAPNKKCTVTAIDTHCNDHPVRAMTSAR